MGVAPRQTRALPSPHHPSSTATTASNLATRATYGGNDVELCSHKKGDARRRRLRPSCPPSAWLHSGRCKFARAAFLYRLDARVCLRLRTDNTALVTIRQLGACTQTFRPLSALTPQCSLFDIQRSRSIHIGPRFHNLPCVDTVQYLQAATTTPQKLRMLFDAVLFGCRCTGCAPVQHLGSRLVLRACAHHTCMRDTYIVYARL